MSPIELKTELQRMIEQGTDANVLNAILTLLRKTSLDPILKETLTIRALKSEEDIRANRVYSIEEVKKRVR
jgi:hypothetical protein